MANYKKNQELHRKESRVREMKVLNALIKKHNEKKLLKNGLTRCARCKKLILKTDKYCQYCGKSTEIKPF